MQASASSRRVHVHAQPQLVQAPDVGQRAGVTGHALVGQCDEGVEKIQPGGDERVGRYATPAGVQRLPRLRHAGARTGHLFVPGPKGQVGQPLVLAQQIQHQELHLQRRQHRQRHRVGLAAGVAQGDAAVDRHGRGMAHAQAEALRPERGMHLHRHRQSGACRASSVRCR